MAKIVVDAYAWVELFIGTEKGLEVKKILERAEELYTPGTVLAEIARKYLREGASSKTVKARLQTIYSASDVADLDLETASEAAKCYPELAAQAKNLKLNSPSLFDAVVLGTGRILKSRIVTGDEHFRNLPETIWIG